MQDIQRAAYSLDAALARTLHPSDHAKTHYHNDDDDVQDYFVPQAPKQTAFIPLERANTSNSRGKQVVNTRAAMYPRYTYTAKAGRHGGNSLDSSASSSPNAGIPTYLHGSDEDHQGLATLASHMHLLTVHVDQQMLSQQRPLQAVTEERDGEERRDDLSAVGCTNAACLQDCANREKAGRVPIPCIETKVALADRRQALAQQQQEEATTEQDEEVAYDMALVTRWVEYHRALAEEQREQFQALCKGTTQSD
ncbi:hypothetical protein BCR37DRAFT_392024 [Protomyces lactucae-debilis]|uniref:Uncharacterized protein n=1 Tax=Protomyces lactucae-debilis TaxID=2754530 RepID=A0A1Y2FLJ5_PROLT|nr:uncharacterized protein BCR37DRAFT_392024 [Protomyces lactucae-debilis]ORY84447.1 hypothetical protein BCR37DRAFT_392024 [Protomyces lactucae-debilis]